MTTAATTPSHDHLNDTTYISERFSECTRCGALIDWQDDEDGEDPRTPVETGVTTHRQPDRRCRGVTMPAPDLSKFIRYRHIRGLRGHDIIAWGDRSKYRCAWVYSDGEALRLYWLAREGSHERVTEAIWSLGSVAARTMFRARGRWCRLDAAALLAAVAKEAPGS